MRQAVFGVSVSPSIAGTIPRWDFQGKKGPATMGTKVRKRRSVADISRLSAQTRLTAWAVFKELTRDGMDQTTALRKALQDACPPKDDPYYRLFYPNKMRELELWRKRGLWPLSKPKDFEYYAGPHDDVDVSTDDLDDIPETATGAPSLMSVPGADLSQADEPIDTLEFDPVEVAKIIESYEQDPVLFIDDADELNESGTQDDASATSMGSPSSTRPVRLKTGAKKATRVADLSDAEGKRIAREFCEEGPSEPGPSHTGSLDAARNATRDRSARAKLDQDTIDELLAMLAWWKQHKERLAPSTSPVLLRPDFSGEPSVTKRIRMNAKLWAAGEKAAKKQPEMSGGSLAGLLEFLLWRHLGSTDTHLKK